MFFYKEKSVFKLKRGFEILHVLDQYHLVIYAGKSCRGLHISTGLISAEIQIPPAYL